MVQREQTLKICPSRLSAVILYSSSVARLSLPCRSLFESVGSAYKLASLRFGTNSFELKVSSAGCTGIAKEL